MFDRETRREKIIEAKQREQKLKTKSSAKVDATTTKDKQAQLAEAEARMVREAGKEFEELVEKLVSGRTPGCFPDFGHLSRTDWNYILKINGPKFF